jgi:hypothetical protein
VYELQLHGERAHTAMFIMFQLNTAAAAAKTAHRIDHKERVLPHDKSSGSVSVAYKVHSLEHDGRRHA